MHLFWVTLHQFYKLDETSGGEIMFKLLKHIKQLDRVSLKKKITSSGGSVLRQHRLIFDLWLYKALTPFHGVKVTKPSNYVFELEYEQLSIIHFTQHSRSSKDISTTFKWSHSPKCTNLYQLRFAKYSSLWHADGWCMVKINGFNWGFGWKRKKIYI